MKKINQFLRWYFLEISGNPVTFGAVGGFLLFTMHFAFVVAPYWPSEKAIELFYQSLTLLPAYVFAFSLFNLLVVRFKITRWDRKQDEIVIFYDDNDNPCFYQGPLWGKYLVKIVKLPEGWEFPPDKKVHELRLVMKVATDQENVVYPICLSFLFPHQFSAADVDEVIKLQPELCVSSDYYHLDKCLTNIFLQVNRNGEKERRLQNATYAWLNSNCRDRGYILKDLEKSMSMPKLFDWSETEIRLLSLGVRTEHK